MNTERIKELKEILENMKNRQKEQKQLEDFFEWNHGKGIPLRAELQAREECQKEIEMLKERIELLKEQIWNYETLDDCTIVADKGEFKAIEETK
jgi:TorA maturation chaperone TorD